MVRNTGVNRHGEHEHVTSGSPSGNKTNSNPFKNLGTSYELFIILSKVAQLKKDLKMMKRNENFMYSSLRKKIFTVRKDARKLLNLKNVSVEKMRSIVKNLNSVDEKMKEMAIKGSPKWNSKETVGHSTASLKDASTNLDSTLRGKKKKINKKTDNEKKIVGIPVCHKSRTMLASDGNSKSLQHGNCNPKIARSDSTKLSNGKESVSRSTSSDLSLYGSSSIYSCEENVSKLNLNPEVCRDGCLNAIAARPSNSEKLQNDEKQDVESSTKYVARRWSIPSVNRKSLLPYLRETYRQNGGEASGSYDDNERGFYQTRSGRLSFYSDRDFVPMPGLIASEREQLDVVRKRVINDRNWSTGISNLKRDITEGCCFNSNAAIEIFETSDISLRNEEVDHNVLYDRFVSGMNSESSLGRGKKRGHTKQADKGLTKCDGDFAGRKPEVSSGKRTWKRPFGSICGRSKRKTDLPEKGKFHIKFNAKDLEKEKGSLQLKENVKKVLKKGKDNFTTDDGTSKKGCNIRKICRDTQTECTKVTQSTSYDNFILHPLFSWDIPMSGQSFSRRVSLDTENWRRFDMSGTFRRSGVSSVDTGTATTMQQERPSVNRSSQTNDVLFTSNMHQVMYLNVVYTKTHLRYILPKSIHIPNLSRTPEVIERRAIDNGYAVTTYKADPDGVIHFTLAYSEGKKKGASLPQDVNRRLCQLKNLWIYSARKFFTQLSEKLLAQDEAASSSTDVQTRCLSCSSDNSLTSSRGRRAEGHSPSHASADTSACRLSC